MTPQEKLEDYVKTNEGKLTMLALEFASTRIRYQSPSADSPNGDFLAIEFRQLFVKHFMAMVIHADEIRVVL